MKNLLTAFILNTEKISVLSLWFYCLNALVCNCMLIKAPFAQATVYFVGECTILTTEINYTVALQTFYSLYCTASNHYAARRPLRLAIDSLFSCSCPKLVLVTAEWSR